jgi:ClpP class serine protease
VQSLADGSSILAERALELGLIDGVKHQWEVIKDIQEKYNLGDSVCWE